MAGSRKTPDSPLDASGLRIAIVIAAFNGEITERLHDGARECLSKNGVPDDHVTTLRVPGAFELPLAAQRLAATHDAVVAIGCVIRGGTPHFDYVCQAATYGLERVALDSGKPVGFGVLTTDDREQAEARAGGVEGNKGFDAAQSAIEMAIGLGLLE